MVGQMEMAADRSPSSDAVMSDRITRSGRRLFYRLDVIQQPERARACGSGPKSSSDRRPVDPPPVVELRIYEGPTFDQAKDITFTYNANFFLFATLEHARPMAHGRVQTPAANTPPVLTGMPVSGMAYLDRPQEAGYFLFPDLSVRHEGRYRLTFNLYEETKEEMDKEPDTGNGPQGASFDWRMEVKSADFTVYSAKKFPGLTSSTTLSRTMAEQGTRVRIRRDVRMRRRENKPSGDYENDEEEGFRRHRSQTPESQPKDYRGRSTSGGSGERTPLTGDPQRRPSGTEFAPPPPPPPPPGFPSTQVPAPSHLTMGGAAYGSHHQYAPHPNGSGHASPVPQSPSYHKHHSAYPPPPQPPTPTYQDRRMSDHASAQQSRLYPNPSPQREHFTADVRRMSNASHSTRPMTPQSANELRSGEFRPVAPAPVPESRVRLPSIQSFLEPPPPPAPKNQPPILLPSPPNDPEHNPNMPTKDNGSRKRSHDDYSSQPLIYNYKPLMYSSYRPTPVAKNGQRPEANTSNRGEVIIEEVVMEYRNARNEPRQAPWVKYGRAAWRE